MTSEGNWKLALITYSLINRVPDGLDGKLGNTKWAALGKCSADTALRDVNDLLARGVLRRLEGGGHIKHRKLTEDICSHV